jgi:hypothetical protein
MAEHKNGAFVALASKPILLADSDDSLETKKPLKTRE